MLIDAIINTNLCKFIIAFKFRLIDPKLDKSKGEIIASKIKEKGKDLRIHGYSEIKHVKNIHIGNYVRIGKGAYLSCAGGLFIGDNVQISRNVLIYTNNHNINSTAIPYDRSYIYKPVNIGNSVWIGMNVTILPGTNIGDGAVIGMGTVVSGDIPKGAIVVGAKPRIVGYRDINDFDKKDEQKKYFGFLYPDN